MKKICICVITYNQENEIKRALDSLLRQKEWGLSCIVVGDDCSQDRTWEILNEYEEKYPDLVKAYRNDQNLGIYPNYEKTMSYLPESDLYGFLSGDDECCDGFFEMVQNLVEAQCVDTTDAVGIYSDWKTITPSGKEIIFKQDKVLSGYRLWSLKARGFISLRSLLFSKSVLIGFEPVLVECGLNLTESHFDSQAPLNIKKTYYLPFVTTIYYSGIGVSTHLNLKKSDYLTWQVIEKWNYAMSHYICDNRDLYYAKSEILRAEYYIQPTWLKLIDFLYYRHLGSLPGCKRSFRQETMMLFSLIKYKLL